MNGGGWHVALDGIVLSGGDGAIELADPSDPHCGFGFGPFGVGAFGEDGCVPAVLGTIVGCLTSPPDGMGLPGLRTEDVTYPQRDGSKHFSDWYEPRTVTLDQVWIPSHDCAVCSNVRARVRDLMGAWSRRCDDAELVIYTDCHGSGEDRSLVGPFGVIGRPRVAELTWVGQGTRHAYLTLRFDAVDHRMYVLNDVGEPGSGWESLTLTPDTETRCRTYPRCYTDTWCYPVVESLESGPVTGTVSGDLCASPTIVLHGGLTLPRVENVLNGQVATLQGVVLPGETVTIDTADGTAVDSTGTDVTYLLTGDTRIIMDAGEAQMRLVSYEPGDTGYAVVSWRPAVEWA